MRVTPLSPRWPRPGRRRGISVGALAFLLMSSLVVGTASTAQADAISQKRKQAARLADAIDSLNTRIEKLDEDELDAQVTLGRLRKSLVRTNAAVGNAELRLETMRKAALAHALHDYANPAGDVDLIDGSESLNEAERQAIYRRQALDVNQNAQDALRSARQDLARQRSTADRARRSMDQLSRLLQQRRRQADALIRKYEALEVQAKGDLARLVQEEQVRRAAAEAAKARAELARRATAARAELARRATAAEAAARQAAKDQRRGRPSLGATQPKDRAALARDKQLPIDAGLVADIPGSPGGRQAVQLALAQLGKPYVWGAAGPGSYDCSGLMLYAWRAAGRSLPHSSRSQFASTTRVSVGQVQLGDLLFYGSPIHHVGMYIGGGLMVEASRRGKPVKTASIFRRDLVGVGRVG